MNKEPIIIVSGEPNSVFLEILFKSLKTNTYRSPLIIIVSKKLLEEQMKKLSETDMADLQKIINQTIDIQGIKGLTVEFDSMMLHKPYTDLQDRWALLQRYEKSKS